jgi:hypothetical protein
VAKDRPVAEERKMRLIEHSLCKFDIPPPLISLQQLISRCIQYNTLIPGRRYRLDVPV